MMSLTVAGTAVLNSLVSGLSPELAAMLLASVIGGYTLIGGLGATFYVSYFNTALIFFLILMLVIEVFYNPSNNPENPFGSSEAVFDYISCWKTPDEDMGNKGGSYLTFFPVELCQISGLCSCQGFIPNKDEAKTNKSRLVVS